MRGTSTDLAEEVGIRCPPLGGIIVIFTFLGTAAAEGWPALFCECETCAQARKLGGKNIRRRASYQLGDTIHIDWGPDSYSSMLQFELDYTTLRHLLITHAHSDHWMPKDLYWRKSGYSKIPVDSFLNIYGNPTVELWLDEKLDAEPADCALAFQRAVPFQPIDLDEAVATPLLAAHDQSQECLLYHIDTGSSQILIGHDSGWFPEATWDFLASCELDYLLIDTTYGTRDKRDGHMGGMAVIDTATHARKIGALATDCTVIATHFSHNCGTNYDAMVDFFAPHGILVSYDGMQLDL